MLINEDFYRCSECGSAYFEIKEIHLLREVSLEHKPPIENTQTTYICDKCGKSYTREELNNEN